MPVRSTSARLYLQLTIALACTLLLPAMSHAQQQKQLRFQFQEGTSQDLSIEQVTNLTIGSGDKQNNVTVKQLMTMRRQVDSVAEDGSAKLTQQITRIQLGSEGNQQGLNYDSQSDKEPEGLASMVAPLFKSLTSSQFKVTMSPQGEITDVVLPQQLIDAANKARGLPGVGEMLSAEGLTRMMKQSGLKFPAEGVSPGKSWTDKLELQNTALGKQVVTTTYTYEGEEVVDGKTLDKIGVSTQIDFGNPPNGVKLTIADQKSTGYILFDNQAGDLVSSKLSMDMSLQIAVGDTELSQNIKTNVDVKVLPEKE